MPRTAEYQMMNELIDQVRWNCTVLDAVKRCAQSPEDIREINNALETSKCVIEKTRETLKTVPSPSLNDGIEIVAEVRQLLLQRKVLVMKKELPNFRFHPDPISTGAFVENQDEVECPVCHKQTEYVYAGPFYSKEEYDHEICPWCIASGQAAEKFDGTFQDGAIGPGIESEISEDELDELIHRTPGYVSWQGERWLVHCGSPCAFMDYVGWDEIKDHLDRFIDLEEDSQTAFGFGVNQLSEFLYNGGDCQGYLFECIHCHGYRLYIDAN